MREVTARCLPVAPFRADLFGASGNLVKGRDIGRLIGHGRRTEVA